MVFGGLIRHIGTAIIKDSNLILTVDFNTDNIVKGDSIAINGVCLTVVDKIYDKIIFNLSEETMNVTTFKNFKESVVNIDFPLKYDQTLDGHILSGHVHETGKVITITENKNSTDIWIEVSNGDKLSAGKFNADKFSTDKLKYKDSIVVDGISLTIAEVNGNKFRVAIIPYTYTNTNLKYLSVDDYVNIEYNHYNQDYQNHNIQKHELSDLDYMLRALKLSEIAKYKTSPNPWVGCVIVKNNEIIGEGYHLKAGCPHAEVNAFSNIVDDLDNDFENTTVYVTLEPCSHYGRTPPCVELLLRKKVKKVVIGLIDPDIRVSGKSVDILRSAGVEVITGVCKEEIEKSLEPYLYNRINKLPYVTLKLAISLDGAIQDYKGESQWITCPESRKHCHKLWSQHMGIMVGTNTIINDNPTLTIQDYPTVTDGDNDCDNDQPIRIILDRCGKLKHTNFKIFDKNNRLIIFTGLTIDEYKKITNSEHNEIYTVPVINNNDNHLDLLSILSKLNDLHITSILVEGGIKLNHTFLVNNLAQQLYVYRSTHILGENSYKWLYNMSDKSIHDKKFLKLENVEKLDEDILEHYKIIDKYNK